MKDRSFEEPRVTPHIAACVLENFNVEGGYAAGLFHNSLITTIRLAPSSDRARIAINYPGVVEAVDLMALPYGVNVLRAYLT